MCFLSVAGCASVFTMRLTWRQGSSVCGWTAQKGRRVGVPCTPPFVWRETRSHTGNQSHEPIALPHLQYRTLDDVIASDNQQIIHLFSSIYYLINLKKILCSP